MASCYSHTSMAVELIVLFVEGQPLVFEVKRERHSYFFTPLTSWKDTLDGAGFSLQKRKDKWEVIGIEDKNLIDQAIEEVERRSF